MDAIVFSRARNYTNWCYCKGTDPVTNPASPGSETLQNHSRVPPACRKLDGVVAWLMNGVAAAFFMSLERCSCIHIDTKDDADDVQFLAPDLPSPSLVSTSQEAEIEIQQELAISDDESPLHVKADDRPR
ncbi:hypothetical protein PTKIN_Ptkin07bG0258700 [Pterospermum kingtungense]